MLEVKIVKHQKPYKREPHLWRKKLRPWDPWAALPQLGTSWQHLRDARLSILSMIPPVLAKEVVCEIL